MTNTDPEEIQELLSRGVEDDTAEGPFGERPFSGSKVLTIYIGSRSHRTTKTHLGLATIFVPEKLRALQDFGHHVILICSAIFTASIGGIRPIKTGKRPLLPKKK